jgi:hypothetical protein
MSSHPAPIIHPLTAANVDVAHSEAGLAQCVRLCSPATRNPFMPYTAFDILPIKMTRFQL